MATTEFQIVLIQLILDRNEIVDNDCHKCICDKKCKGLCGLKVHHVEQLHF